MKKIFFILFFLSFRSFTCQMHQVFAVPTNRVPDEITTYRNNDDPKKIIILIQNKQDIVPEGTDFLDNLSEKHYISRFLKKINRSNPVPIVITDIENKVNMTRVLYPPFSEEFRLRLSHQLEKELCCKKDNHNKLSVYSQSFRTSVLGLPLRLLGPIMGVSAYLKPRNDKKDQHAATLEQLINPSSVTVKEYIEELGTLELYMQNHQNKVLQDKFNTIEKAILKVFKTAKTNDLLKVFLLNLYKTSKTSFFKNNVILWIAKLDSFISELSIEDAFIVNNRVVMINCQSANAQNLKEFYLTKNFKDIDSIKILPPLNGSNLKMLQEMGCPDNAELQEPFNSLDDTMQERFLNRIANEVREPIACSGCLKLPERGKKFLVCRNCMETRYCSKNCQKSDWPSHRDICGGKKLFECNACHAITSVSKQFKVCAGCKAVHYCSKECQKTDWEFHKLNCSSKKEV